MRWKQYFIAAFIVIVILGTKFIWYSDADKLFIPQECALHTHRDHGVHQECPCHASEDTTGKTPAGGVDWWSRELRQAPSPEPVLHLTPAHFNYTAI